MRSPALAALLLAATAAAAGEDAPACRLAAAECAVVLREVAVDAALFAQDAGIVGLGLSPEARARALIARDEERMAERVRHLPGPVADELRRIQLCRSLGDAAPEPRCR